MFTPALALLFLVKKMCDFIFHFQPIAISMDLKIAAFQAEQLAFPGSFFHFTVFSGCEKYEKALRSRTGCYRRYGNDADFALHSSG